MPTFLYKYIALVAVFGGMIGAIFFERSQVLKCRLELASYQAAAAVASEAARERRASDAKVSKEIDDANSAQVKSMAATINALLMRKPAGVPSAADSHAPGASLPHDGALGRDDRPDLGGTACDPDVAAVATLGWEQVKLWRKYARETGQNGPE
jgi:hypothetical protein